MRRIIPSGEFPLFHADKMATMITQEMRTMTLFSWNFGKWSGYQP
jgi:hypothetical protein